MREELWQTVLDRKVQGIWLISVITFLNPDVWEIKQRQQEADKHEQGAPDQSPKKEHTR